MATRRRYTKADKATTVIAAEMSNAAAAAQAAGIPERTVRYWMDDPKFAELRMKTRDEAAAGFAVLMHAAQARLYRLIETMEPRDLTILLGVATDKGQLLSGGPTTRSETRSVTDDLNDDEKQRLRKWIDGLTAAAPAEGAPV